MAFPAATSAGQTHQEGGVKYHTVDAGSAQYVWLISQAHSSIVQTIADRNAITPRDCLSVIVRDATADPNVGFAITAGYVYDLTATDWIRTFPPSWAAENWP